ncbi:MULTISPECIES: T9SS type A sorting domain-containing protein [Zobellia]|uniref:T9SS type A sorting domain-containing protein n=1 Tax=Zobellia TaxID=112040 RepID=UPI001BFF170A|nr:MULTISPECIES: T9SS type A sorting domain-containing protein [Zobellia]MBT9188046.1 T9SS type A sorting domain-containing protein [Zobellia russellii]MBU2974337.1 T9SS type A sorting domain-containing protein [Zobellia sp. B3R18]
MKTLATLFTILFLVCNSHAQDTPMHKTGHSTNITTKKKVKVFPNPASNVVNILGLKNTAKANISVMDIYGNTVLSHQWEIRRNAISIPVSSLDAGAYIINVHSNEEKICTKFYKQ